MATFAFFVIFLPLAIKTKDCAYALQMSFPLLPICMCGFTANNLHDIEKDRENHPNRPLVTGVIHPLTGAAIFFALLAFALAMVRYLVPTSLVFLYLLGLITLINYNYVVFYFPFLKNAFVAAAGTIPLLLLGSIPGAPSIHMSAVIALMFFLFGIELLSDTEDSKGDGLTLANRLGPHRAQLVAFISKILADMVLLVGWPGFAGRLTAAALLLSDILLWTLWWLEVRHRLLINLMKIQIVVGLYYLLFS